MSIFVCVLPVYISCIIQFYCITLGCFRCWAVVVVVVVASSELTLGFLFLFFSIAILFYAYFHWSEFIRTLQVLSMGFFVGAFACTLKYIKRITAVLSQ